VVQASAADWAIVLLAGLRRRLAAISMPNETGVGPAAQAAGLPGDVARGEAAPNEAASGEAAPGAVLVFFQHDEVIVHCPEGMAGAVADAVGSAAAEAGQLVFGPTPVRFPVTTAVVASYADAK
jgi:DNA polymerase-1